MFKGYKEEWAQRAARHRLKKLRGGGQSMADIGRTLGFSGVYIGNVLRAERPAAVSKRLWEAMEEKLNFAPDPNSASEPMETDIARDANPQGAADLEALLRTQQQMLYRIEQTLTSVSMALNVLLSEHIRRGPDRS